MINLLRDFFGKARVPVASGETQEARHDVRIATCALFLEMAHIDGEFSEEEQAHIISILKSKYQLTDEFAAALMGAAREELDRSLDCWQFARLINQHYTDEEKKEIIELAWRIVYVDGRLDMHEDYLMHKLSKLLRVPHKQFIEAKLKAKPEVY
jgi:uncharacterized tellurite resistance protein B-like protein